jgi:hypothetical protein
MLLPDGTPLIDGVGLPPDVTVWNATDDAANGIDTILQTAVDLLAAGSVAGRR